MNKLQTVFPKLLVLLLFGVGWGNAAWAQSPQGVYKESERKADAKPQMLSEVNEQWTVIITGENAEPYKATYKDVEHEAGTPFDVDAGFNPFLDLRITCTDKFVWGPVVDEEKKTVTYEVRSVPTALETGWYQIMLVDDPSNTDAQKRASVDNVNQRIHNNSGNINTQSNYIYVMPMYNNTNPSPMQKYSGIPKYAEEAATYYYITVNSGNINIQSPNGYYLQNGRGESAQQSPQSITNYSYDGHYLQMGGWVAPNYWSGGNALGADPGNQGPIVASGGNNVYYEKHIITKVDAASKYDIYRVNWDSESTAVKCASGKGNTVIIKNGYLFLPKGTEVTKDLFVFEGTGAAQARSVSVGELTADGWRNINLLFHPLGDNVQIVVQNEDKTPIEGGTVKYSGTDQNGQPVAAALTHGQPYNFGNVPYLSSLFASSPAYELLTTEFDDADEANKTLTFTVRALNTKQWTVKITKHESNTDEYTVTAYGYHKLKNNEKVALPEKLEHYDFTIDAPSSKFVWGPVFDEKRRTITFDVREPATTFQTGFYQVMVKTDQTALIDEINNDIRLFKGNANTPSHYLYIAPTLYDLGGATYKFTGVPTQGTEILTAVYVETHDDGTLMVEAVQGKKFDNIHYEFHDGVLTLNNAAIPTYGTTTVTGAGGIITQMAYEPQEMPMLYPRIDANTQFVLTQQLKAQDYDIWRVEFDGDVAEDEYFTYKYDLIGGGHYTNGSIFVMPHNVQPSKGDFYNPNYEVVDFKAKEYPSVGKAGTVVVTVATSTAPWKGIIKPGKGLNDSDVSGYKLKVGTQEYESGATILVPLVENPATYFRTTCDDRFVWGPIVDEANKTITFEIRPVPETIETGWYQIMLADEEKSKTVNRRIATDHDHLNSMGSYIYVAPMVNQSAYKEQMQPMLKFTGRPTGIEEVVTYVYIQKNADNNISVLLPNGYYLENGKGEYGRRTQQNFTNFTYTTDHILKMGGWTAPALWTGADNQLGSNHAHQGPIVASGNAGTYFQDHRITKVDPTEQYNIYRVTWDLPDASVPSISYYGSDSAGAEVIMKGGFIFLDKATEESAIKGTDFRYADQKIFSSINIEDKDGWKYIHLQVTPELATLSNMILHRQHGVYNQLEKTPENMRPTNKAFIQVGGGMIDHPYASEFTSEHNTNDHKIQNTSIFTITQYVIPGTTTEVILPFTKGKTTQGHIEQYHRWYNFKTERCLPDSVLTLSGYYKFTNGLSNYGRANPDNPVISRLRSVYGSATIHFPSDGTTELLVACDASEYQDMNIALSNGNMLEPSLNEHTVFRLINANEMTKKLTKVGETPTDDKVEWWEDHTFLVPNVSNGADIYDNNAVLLPLDLCWPYYFVPKADGTPMPLVAETGNYTTLKSHLRIEVEGTAKEYINVGVFEGQGGLGSCPYISSNHFLYYQIKGSGHREIPAYTEATIKVYGKNEAGTEYQLARFNLEFHPGGEPLAISSIISPDPANPISDRSPEYMEANGYTRVAELTFQTPSVEFDYNTLKSHRNDAQRVGTYAFPIDPIRTSYSYSPHNTFGSYKVGLQNYGISYAPASVYVRNIQNLASTDVYVDDDYFLYIDAAEAPGQVCSVPITGTLCPGTRLSCYGYIGSTNYFDDVNNQVAASIQINVVGIDEDGGQHIIASYLPGPVSDVGFAKDGSFMRSLGYGGKPSTTKAAFMQVGTSTLGVWQQVGFSFNLSKDQLDYDHFEIQVVNNCHSTAGGDYLLDDFVVYAKLPRVDVEFTTPLCTDALRHVKCYADFDMIIEATNTNIETTKEIPLSFCFLHKETFDTMTDAYFYTDDLGRRTIRDDVNDTDPTVKKVFADAFNEALVGVITTNKNTVGYAFHNFMLPTDFESMPAYAYNDSPEPALYREVRDNGERRIIFKEGLYQPRSVGRTWEPDEEYYLVATPQEVKEEDLQKDPVMIGVQVYNVANRCFPVSQFTIMPPTEIKGDAHVRASDLVKACSNQTITFKVDMPALKLNEDKTTVTDVVITDLYYDWWIGMSKEDSKLDHFEAATYGEYADIQDAKFHNYPSGVEVPADDAAIDRKVYLKSALENIRFFYPYARSLDEVELKEYQTANGYAITQEMIDCVRYFTTPLANGRRPLTLYGQTYNLNVSLDESELVGDNHLQYFVACPIVPEQDYANMQDLIYCPEPQMITIMLEKTAPTMLNGFASMPYPESITNVPVRIGLQQANAVRKAAASPLVDNTLNIPLRNITITGATSQKLLPRDFEFGAEGNILRFGEIFLTATDDPAYDLSDVANVFTLQPVAQVIDIHATGDKDVTEDYMKIALLADFALREGFTYTLKLPFIEDEECDCEGTMAFDLKVVPEYQEWTAEAGSSDWTNDDNWRRADRDVLLADNTPAGDIIQSATDLTNEATYPTNATNTTSNGFVPMYFTNVLLRQTGVDAPELYKGEDFKRPSLTAKNFLTGLNDATASTHAVYDLAVTPVNAADRAAYNYACDYTCELFDTYVANGVTFEASTQMGDAHFLSYHKAWVEYLLDAGRWYTLASPLQQSYSGDWYSPTAGAKQLTPHFYDINYDPALNDRFRPAYFQRSWDKAGNSIVYEKNGDTRDSYIKADWSHVYNDAAVNYSTGGFSVKADIENLEDEAKPADGKVRVRLPKADTEYTYYDIAGDTGAAADATVSRTNSNRLLIDAIGADGQGTLTLNVSNVTADNNFLLLSNPFMAAMDMTKFFEANTDLEPKYWILEDRRQSVSIYTTADDDWTSTSGAGQYIAPLQGFFVKTKADATTPNAVEARYTADMQRVVNADDYGKVLSVLSARTPRPTITITAERGQERSEALVVVSEHASNAFVSTEDCETFIDSHLLQTPTVYTTASQQAMTVNSVQSVDVIPVGIISRDDAPVTLTFDLYGYDEDALYLYDSVSGEQTPLEDGTSVTVEGNTAGRYFIRSSRIDQMEPAADMSVKRGVWNTAGQYFGTSTEGLEPGLYIVDGVKMLIK